MNEIEPQHLVIVRHGEGEGDLRRAAFKRGESYVQMNSIDEEPLTDRGIEQNRLGGVWIKQNIIAVYGIEKAIGFVSPTLRTLQSATAMDMPEIIWQADDRLGERDRGLIKGWRSERHRSEYPESFRQMREDPVYWVPPNGESITDNSQQFKEFINDTDDAPIKILVTHRDRMWAGLAVLEGLSPHQLADVNTDEIRNGQIWDYTNVNPQTGETSPDLRWKRSICPWADPSEIAAATDNWIDLATVN